MRFLGFRSIVLWPPSHRLNLVKLIIETTCGKLDSIKLIGWLFWVFFFSHPSSAKSAPTASNVRERREWPYSDNDLLITRHCGVWSAFRCHELNTQWWEQFCIQSWKLIAWWLANTFCKPTQYLPLKMFQLDIDAFGCCNLLLCMYCPRFLEHWYRNVDNGVSANGTME